MPAAPGCRAGAENLKRCAHRLAAASGRRRLDHESFCRSGLVNTDHWCQGPPCTKIQGVYRPCESGVEPIETIECGSTKRPGEKRNDDPARCQCRACIRAAVVGCCGPWARRHPTGCATSRAQRGDEQVLPMPHRCDVSRSATGSTRIGRGGLWTSEEINLMADYLGSDFGPK